ncbi:MAG: NADH-quinone oxidoreductase subunit H, partial [Gammaproteobacteria bacterium]|nr:NADH-quinone oxidoreductase subunit H [Gammaproteobacteria bacterium]
MNGTRLFLEFLLFPGLLFTAAAGLLTSWVDRKVTAMVQMRVGPPLLQPFYDLRKFFIKETCVPQGGAIGLFLLAPLLGFAAVVVASMILWRAFINPEYTFIGDVIVLIYLFMLPALSVVLGG